MIHDSLQSEKSKLTQATSRMSHLGPLFQFAF